MPFLKSLLCLKGHDNGRRFLIISFVSYLLLIMFSPVLNKTVILMLIAIVTPVIGSSSIRRIQDANFALPWAAIPITIYWINLFGLAYIEHGARWTLLLVAAITTLAIATVSNPRIKRTHQYKLGYHGPMNFENLHPNSTPKNRIEPTIAGRKNPDFSSDESYTAVEETIEQEVQSNDQHPNLTQQDSWEYQLGQWFIANRKMTTIVVSIIILLSLLIILISPAEQRPVTEIETDRPIVENTKQRLNKIEMPDQFWIMLDENDSLTIGWEGDFKTDGSYWSASTGKGDKDCVDLHFSLGEDIRTLSVTVKNGGDYYADFSPVDTEVIVKSIADKDRFKLCGYEFTLKGTRSLLRENQKYRDYLKIEL